MSKLTIITCTIILIITTLALGYVSGIRHGIVDRIENGIAVVEFVQRDGDITFKLIPDKGYSEGQRIRVN